MTHYRKTTGIDSGSKRRAIMVAGANLVEMNNSQHNGKLVEMNTQKQTGTHMLGMGHGALQFNVEEFINLALSSAIGGIISVLVVNKWLGLK